MIFVEGTAASLDAPLYSLLFPQVSIVPKDACRDVEHAVRGLRGAAGMHWASVWGIVDNDQRPTDDVARLRAAGVWALPHYSVEALYYHPTVIARVAARQAALLGSDAAAMVENARVGAVAAAQAQREHLITGAVLRSARREVSANLPTHESIVAGAALNIGIDVAALRVAEETRFDALVAAADWDGLLIRYPVRQSAAFERIIEALRLPDKATYRAAVLKLLQDEPAALTELRDLLGDLYANVAGDAIVADAAGLAA
jgi:hypothetical protein